MQHRVRKSVNVFGLRMFLCALSVACAAALLPMKSSGMTAYREWIAASGGTPTIDGGTDGTAANAFDGSVVADQTGRYLGGYSAASDAYVIYGADIENRPFTMTHYRICQSTAGEYSNARAPSAWTLYGSDSAAGPWTSIETRSGVVWSGSSFAAEAAIPDMADCWRTFTLESPVAYKFYKIAFAAAADPDYTGNWKIAVMEIEYIGIGDDASYPYAFNAAMSSELMNPSAWSCNEVPSSDKDVWIRGNGIVNYSAESTRFASLTVKGGATLSVSGGTDESPVDMPPVELDLDARLLLSEGAVVQITNTFTCIGHANVLPVFEVATNATAIVQTPVPLSIRHSTVRAAYAGLDYGFRIKNVALRWYGDIKTYHADTGARTEYCRLLLGWAEADETSYIAVDCRGGRYFAAGEANSSCRGRTPLAMAIPQPGGSVVPVGTLYFRDYSCVQRTSSAPNGFYYTPGLYIGRWNEVTRDERNIDIKVDGNPASIKFNVLFEGTTDVNLIGVFRIGGGAHVVLRGPEVQWKYTRNNKMINNDEDLPRAVFLNDCGSLGLEDGAYLDICSSDDVVGNQHYSAKGLRANGTEAGQTTFSASNSRMSLLHWYGAKNSLAEISDSVLEIGYLRSASTLGNITGVFNGFQSVAISDTFTIAAADVDRGAPSKTSVTSVENWNRCVHIAPPLTGTGALAVSNELSGAHAVYSMTVTVTNGANTATGRAFVADTAGGAPAALVFADGANWAGEVVADGNVSLTNLVDEGSAASVSFGSLKIENSFPIRVWKTGGAIVANDKVNLSSAIAGTGTFRFVEMDEPLSLGDMFEIGLYPANAALPRDVKPFRYSAKSSGTEGYVRLFATYQKRGFTLVFR